MDVQVLTSQLSSDFAALLIATSSPPTRNLLLDGLKDQADIYWGKDPRISLLMAQMLITLGEVHHDKWYQALGMMARGDALRFMGRFADADAALRNAGDQFAQLGDSVGWARTRIGLLLLSIEFGEQAVAQALVDVDEARHIFVREHRNDFLIRLTLSLSAFHQRRFEFKEATKAIELGLVLTSDEESVFRARLLHSSAVLAQSSGRLEDAEKDYQEAQTLYEKLEQPQSVCGLKCSLASLRILEGRYLSALRLLDEIGEQIAPGDIFNAQINKVVCYQYLGMLEKARFLAYQLLENDMEHLPLSVMDRAYTHMYLSEIEAGLGNWDQSSKAVATASQLFESIDAQQNLYELLVRHAEIQLRRGEPDAAFQLATAALNSEDDYTIARAQLILGEAALRSDSCELAIGCAVQAFWAARRNALGTLQFSVDMLMGWIREHQGRLADALTHFEHANERVVVWQRQLNIDLRPNFLASTQQALRAVIRVLVKQESYSEAFQALENLKSMVLLQYLLSSQRTTTASEADIQTAAELDSCRHRIQWLLSIERGENTHPLTPEQLRVEKHQIVDRMRELHEQRRLQADWQTEAVSIPTLNDLGRALPMHSLLLEYYVDGETVSAFVLNHKTEITFVSLACKTSVVAQYINKMRRFMSRALASPPEAATGYFLQPVLSALQALYDALIRPLQAEFGAANQLIIVPFGLLHAIPFHLFHDGTQYLVEGYEITICTAAGLLTRPPIQRTGGVLALGYNDSQQDNTDADFLMEVEAERVKARLGGNVFVGADAVSSCLALPPRQVLHLAAHGEFNLDQPHISNINLADGPLYADDLLQFDLSYELVVLSACSVGLGRASGGDEQIGLGRAFLYAGANALLTSLWDVDDVHAERFMRAFYEYLIEGRSKSAALRQSQIDLLREGISSHPAFWGAFQLIGNPAGIAFHGAMNS